MVFVAILYVLGRGLASLLASSHSADWSSRDFWLVLVPLIVGIAATALITMIEKRISSATEETINGAKADAAAPPSSASGYTLVFEEGPITLDNFYTGIYFGHSPSAGGNPEHAKSTPAMIAEAEARLGIVFPPLLRKLYERQNGGQVDSLCVPVVANPTSALEDWRSVFAYDYSYLAPLDKLRTLYDGYLYFMSEEEIAQDPDVPKDAKRYIVLCQRYLDTTFLDYSRPGQPRVGIVDFQQLDRQDVWFDSFEDFFKALRRGELA